MALRLLESFDTVVPAAGLVSVVSLVGTQHVVRTGSTTTTNATVTRDGSAMVVTTPASASSAVRFINFVRPIQDIMTTKTGSIISGGVRIKFGGTKQPLGYFGVADSPRSAMTQTFIDRAIATADKIQLNVEYYLEWLIDTVSKQFHYWLDGVKTATVVTLTAATIALFTNNKVNIVYGDIGGVSTTLTDPWTLSINDVYMMEKTSDSDVMRWGPIKLQPVTVSSAETTWVSSSGTVKDALNTPITDTASYSAPTVTGDTTAANLKMSLPGISGEIKAMKLFLIAKTEPSGGAVDVTITTATGESVTTGVEAVLGDNPVTLHLSERSPSGAPWTKSMLEKSSFKLASS